MISFYQVINTKLAYQYLQHQGLIYVLIVKLQKMQNQKREVKILISSDCQGRLQTLMAKVGALQAKNQFDFIILNGEVCHPRSSSYISSLRNQEQSLPLPAYFIDNSQMSPILQKTNPFGLQIAPHFNFLGAFGIHKIKEIVIAYFGINKNWEKSPPSQQQIDQFLNMCKGKRIDILLTNQWPKEIKQYSKREGTKTSNYVSKLASFINPHYHIAAGGNGFYRMPPYTNSEGFLTHFISVAPFQENPIDKYLFGLTVSPGQEEMSSSTVIQNPYQSYQQQKEEVSNQTSLLKAKLASSTSTKQKDNSQTVVYFQGFPDWSRNSDITQFLQRWGQIKTVEVSKQMVRGSRCGWVRFQDPKNTQSCISSSQKILFHTKRIKFTRKTMRQSKRRDDCWFCKQKGDQSLIVYQGKYCYISLQKGPLCRHHLQIVPLSHVETTGRLQIAQKEEIEHCIRRISKYFTEKEYEVIEYQRYLPLSQSINHAVVHIVPLKSGKLLKQFESLNSKDNLGFKPFREQYRKSQHFIKAKFGENAYIKEINKKDRVQADFMRIILSQLLDNPRLVNWKQCIRNEKEIKEVQVEIISILEQIGIIESK